MCGFTILRGFTRLNQLKTVAFKSASARFCLNSKSKEPWPSLTQFHPSAVNSMSICFLETQQKMINSDIIIDLLKNSIKHLSRDSNYLQVKRVTAVHEIIELKLLPFSYSPLAIT